MSLVTSIPAKMTADLKSAFRMPHGKRADVAASRQSAANCDGNSNGGFLPKAATPKADLLRRSDSPRRNAVKTGAKTEGNSFPEFILGWTIGVNGV